MYNVRTASDALEVLSGKSHSYNNIIYARRDTPPPRQDAIQMRNIEYRSLTHQTLLSYLMKRKIDIRIGRAYCCEVHYDLRDKHFFGIAFRNRIGGYEVRNPYYKGCIGHKDITLIRHNKECNQEHVIVFEGFMDFLSYLMLCEAKSSRICIPYPCDYIVLNSINCLDKAMTELKSYKFVHSFLDNDDGGKRTFESMKEQLSDKIIDESHRYSDYNDLNDYLVKQSPADL